MVPSTIPLLTLVDVWCASTQRWVPGFRVAAVRADGSIEVFGRDGGPRLPEAFAPSMVRITDVITLPAWHVLAPS